MQGFSVIVTRFVFDIVTVTVVFQFTSNASPLWALGNFISVYFSQWQLFLRCENRKRMLFVMQTDGML